MVSRAKDLWLLGFALLPLIYVWSTSAMNVHTQIDFALFRFIALIEINSLL